MALTDTQLQQFKATLSAQYEKLQGVLTSLKNGDPSSDVTRTTDNADIGTEATESNELVAYESLENETTILLERTKAALDRIEAGTYGVTDDGVEIPYERLMVEPTATTTIQ